VLRLIRLGQSFNTVCQLYHPSEANEVLDLHHPWATLPFEWLNIDTPPLEGVSVSSFPSSQNPHLVHIRFMTPTTSGLLHGLKCRGWNTDCDV
jgi:hypothetical protein